ncbi:MAG: hypothetical protein ACJ8C4_15185 [Gemmataceae bacterium]
MILAFSTLKVRDLCLHQTKAEAKYGYAIAKQLRARITDLRAAESVRQLIAGHPKAVERNPHERYAIMLQDGFQLIFEPNYSDVPQKKSGGVDWNLVRRIKILRIEVKHA